MSELKPEHPSYFLWLVEKEGRNENKNYKRIDEDQCE
jgi:hypothetical protein